MPLSKAPVLTQNSIHIPQSPESPASEAFMEMPYRPETSLDLSARVKVQKRDPQAIPVLREKICATCHKPFALEADQKFYDCPSCYRKAHPQHKPKRRGRAQILVQIECVECGAREFLDFAPPDSKTALCRECFSKKKREEKNVEPTPRTR